MIPSYNLCAIFDMYMYMAIMILMPILDHSCSKQILGQCSAETSPLRKQIIFMKWQLFQLICDLKLEQYGRVFGSHFWVII